ncbi:hypothetical protein MMC25_008265 [Agyrium rufum]|nr:hypothetical protein [Agyrium rufum]
MGGSIFSSTSTLSAPVELQPLVAFQTDSTRLESAFNKIFPTVDQEYKAISNRDSGAPSPPVHAARLSALLKSLAQAEGAVHASLRAREALIESLEKLLDTNRQALERDQTHQVTLQAMRETVEATKRDVEDLIMRGLSTNANDSMSPAQVRPLNDDNTHLNAEPEPPQMEELTPPPAETILTPEIASYLPNLVAGYDLPQDLLMGDTQSNTESMSTPQTLMAGSDLLSSLSIPAIRSWSPHSGFANGTLKRRKLETEYSNFQGADAMADLDDDVAELLRQESSGHG